MFEVMFYRNISEINAFPKSLTPVPLYTFQGVLKSDTSILNPSILFDITRETNKVFKANYAYIPTFGRYYFITNITVEENNLWRIDMRVDVLQSFSIEILAQKNAYINRTENSSLDYRFRISDKSIPKSDNYVKKSLDNVNMIFNNLDGDGVYYIVVSSTTRVISVNPKDGINYESINQRLSPFYTQMQMYVFNGVVAFGQIIDEISQDDTVNQYLIEIGALPCDLFEFPNRTLVSEIYCGGKTFSVAGGCDRINYGEAPRVLSTSSTDEYTELYGMCDIDYAFLPTTEYYLYLPFYGEIKIPKSAIYWKINENSETLEIRVKIKSFVDLTNMTLTYYVLDVNDRIVLNHSVSIGIKMPINRSNLEEVKRNQTANMLNYISSLFGSIAQLGIGAAWIGYPITAPMASGMLASGAAGIASSTVSYLSRETLNVEKGGTTFNSESNMALLSTPTKIELYEIHLNYDNMITSKFHNQYGYAYDIVADMSECRGYTEIKDIHIENMPDATEREIEEIYNLLKQGVIIQST